MDDELHASLKKNRQSSSKIENMLDAELDFLLYKLRLHGTLVG